MLRRTTTLLLLVPLLAGGGPPTSEALETLTVTVVGLRNATGSVGVALFDEEAERDFPQATPYRSTSALASTTGVDLTFEDLPAGRYALAVIHDENGNGELDRNEYGLPIEGYGFSNDAMGEMGPPTFGQAAILVDGDTRTRVSVIYLAGG